MFIAIIGTRCSGKSTVQDYLVKYKEFRPVKILQGTSEHERKEASSGSDSDSFTLPIGSIKPAATFVDDDLDNLSFTDSVTYNPNRVSFLTMTSPVSSCLPSPAPFQSSQNQPLLFGSAAELLAHVTKNWRTNFVTIDLITRQVLEDFRTRPFVLVVGVDAPLLTRFRRCSDWSMDGFSLEEFIRQHDTFYFGSGTSGESTPGHTRTDFGGQDQHESFKSISELANLHVVNAFESITAFYEHLEETNLVDPERLRPGWDTYFMQLASLASQRSNCMKRRVGAILVRNKRVVSTGYNGTPRGLTNCNEGGCVRCNSASESSDECLCLHAEENALLEAGRERVGDGSVLYCNTCPCLKCTIKIIQTGVKEVVYNLSYKVDDASAAQFSEAGVVLRRHAMRA